MTDDVSAAQAGLLLKSLYEHVSTTSESLIKAENLIRHTTRHGSSRQRQSQRIADMRKDLYEAHRLIDGLHRRYPATRGTSQPLSRRSEPAQRAR